MSSDNQDRRRKVSNPLGEAEEPRALVVDTTDADESANIKRRRQSVIALSAGPLAGYEKYVPKNCVSKWIEEGFDMPRKHYDNGWEYAVDETNSHVRVQVNRDPNAKEKYNILMYIPEEFFSEDEAKLRKEREDLVLSRGNEGNPNIARRPGEFFEDLGFQSK